MDDRRTRNEIRHRHYFKDESQVKLANVYDISQPRVSQIVNADAETIREDMYDIEGPPCEDDRESWSWPDDYVAQVRFECGFKGTPWIRDVGQVDFEEIVDAVETFVERCPPLSKCRSEAESYTESRRAFERTRKDYAFTAMTFKPLCTARATWVLSYKSDRVWSVLQRRRGERNELLQYRKVMDLDHLEEKEQGAVSGVV